MSLPQQRRQAILPILCVLQVRHKWNSIALQWMLRHPRADVALNDQVDLLQQRHVVHAIVVVPTIFDQCPLIPNRNEPVEKHVDETGVSAKGIQKPVPVVVCRLQSARAALAQVPIYILSANTCSTED